MQHRISIHVSSMSLRRIPGELGPSILGGNDHWWTRIPGRWDAHWKCPSERSPCQGVLGFWWMVKCVYFCWAILVLLWLGIDCQKRCCQVSVAQAQQFRTHPPGMKRHLRNPPFLVNGKNSKTPSAGVGNCPCFGDWFHITVNWRWNLPSWVMSHWNITTIIYQQTRWFV